MINKTSILGVIIIALILDIWMLTGAASWAAKFVMISGALYVALGLFIKPKNDQ